MKSRGGNVGGSKPQTLMKLQCQARREVQPRTLKKKTALIDGYLPNKGIVRETSRKYRPVPEVKSTPVGSKKCTTNGLGWIFIELFKIMYHQQ